MAYDFRRMTWKDGNSRFEVERQTENDGEWCVVEITGFKWKNLIMTEKELYRVMYDHGRPDLVPLEIQAEFEDDPQKYEL